MTFSSLCGRRRVRIQCDPSPPASACTVAYISHILQVSQPGPSILDRLGLEKMASPKLYARKSETHHLSGIDKHLREDLGAHVNPVTVVNRRLQANALCLSTKRNSLKG